MATIIDLKVVENDIQIVTNEPEDLNAPVTRLYDRTGKVRRVTVAGRLERREISAKMWTAGG